MKSVRSVLPQPSLLHPDYSSLSTVVSEAFVRFFVEMVGHYSLFMGGTERDDESVSSPTLPSPPSSSSSSSSASPSPSSFQREAFRKAVTSKSLRRFLEVFMETQMFTGFIQERELRRQGLKGIGVLLLVSTQSYSVILYIYTGRVSGGAKGAVAPGPGTQLGRGSRPRLPAQPEASRNCLS